MSDNPIVPVRPRVAQPHAHWLKVAPALLALALTACGRPGGESFPVESAPPPAECIPGAGILLHGVREGELVRVPHPPGSGQTYDADGARVEIVQPLQAYATLRLVDVTSEGASVLLIVHAFEGGGVLCPEVSR
jgi:hypothetical protein